MKANETILQPILEGTKQYVVPLFQRSYSWKSKNWKTLWEDLLALYDSVDKREHFLGAIVSMPIEMSPAGVNKFLLIDGQQRITTLFLILSAIRDLSKEFDQRLPDQIQEQYLINKWSEGPNMLKLLPSQPDREHFSRIIHNQSPIDTNNSTFKAYSYFKKMLMGKDSKGSQIDLSKMHSVLIQQIVVVSIVLDREENPYLIFESLNAKGEPLTQADLVRNYILMRIRDTGDQEVAYRDFWLPMQESLGNELTNFIWRYLNKDGTFASFVRLTSIYDEVKQKLTKKASNKAEDLLVDMHTYSLYYQRLINPDMEKNKEISLRLKRLNRWEIKTVYPFLLNVYNDYSEERLSSLQFCQILDIIESFVLRRFFCRVPTNALNKIFIGLNNSIDKSDYIESMKLELLQRDWPSDTRFLEAWINFPIYLSGTAKCRHILETLENELTYNNEPVDVRHPEITIEHVMPQTLNESWEETLGKEAPDTYENYLHTIGNLTLTGNNSPMGNASFIEKRKVFAKSNFALNKELADSIIWGEYMILQRAKKLGQLALKIWRHPGEDELPSMLELRREDPTGNKPTGFGLFGTEYKVDTWRDMLLTTLSVLAELYGDEFASKAVNVKTSKRAHIAYEPEGMITPMQIPGTSLWVEANQSSRSVLWVIRQTMDACGVPEDEFEAYW